MLPSLTPRTGQLVLQAPDSWPPRAQHRTWSGWVSLWTEQAWLGESFLLLFLWMKMLPRSPAPGAERPLQLREEGGGCGERLWWEVGGKGEVVMREGGGSAGEVRGEGGR